ncbi:transcription factor Zn, C2H2, partial [Metarhizium majus ARSEF 297]
MASPGAHRSVSAIAEDCIARFESLTASANPARRERLENRGSDFRLWCDGVGARVQGPASLDSRLQGRQDDLDFVKSIMRLLADFLAEYDPSQSQAQVEIATENIDSALGSLSRLGLSIRQSGKASRTRRADRRFNPDDHEEFRTHLRCILLLRPTADGHNMKDIEESRLNQLQKRLIDCNLRRRNRFLLAQKHSEKLKASQRTSQSSKPPERPIASLPIPSSSGHEKDETKAAEPKATESRPKPQREAERAGTNLHSAASTAEGTPLALCNDTTAKTSITSLARTKEFPRPPKPLIGRRIYRCPCCFQSLPDSILSSPTEWT